MTKKDFVQIDLGCGKNKTEGSVGLDADTNSDADIIVNFEKSSIPLKESSVDRVIAKHLLEHLEDPINFLKDIYRILKNNGEIVIEVPHFSSHIAYGIGHRHHFTRKELVQIFRTEIVCDIVKTEITFYKTFRFFGIKYLSNKFPVNYEKFWAYIFPAENLKLTARIHKK